MITGTAAGTTGTTARKGGDMSSVKDHMNPYVLTARPDQTLEQAAQAMVERKVGAAVVVTQGTVVGIITERDVMKAVARGVDVDTTAVSDVMTREVQTVAPETSLHEAARLMATRWIRHLPVVSSGAVVGMVSQRDLVGVLAALAKEPDAVELAADELVRERRLARIEHGDLD